MAIFNESYLNKLFRFGDKKKKTTNTIKQKHKSVAISQDEIKIITQELKKIIDNFNKNQNNRKLVLEALQKYWEETDLDSIPSLKKSEFIYFEPFIYKIRSISQDKSDISYDIVVGDEDYCIAVKEFVKKICNDWNEALKSRKDDFEENIIFEIDDELEINIGIISIFKFTLNKE